MLQSMHVCMCVEVGAGGKGGGGLQACCCSLLTQATDRSVVCPTVSAFIWNMWKQSLPQDDVLSLVIVVEGNDQCRCCTR